MRQKPDQHISAGKPATNAPRDAAALPDATLDQVSGGAGDLQNYWKMLSDVFKSQSDTQSKIIGNLR
jgi:hypothetical protein